MEDLWGVYSFNEEDKAKWEIRYLNGDKEIVIARCKDKSSCFKEITKFLKARGYFPRNYSSYPREKYILIVGTNNTKFHLYELKGE